MRLCQGSAPRVPPFTAARAAQGDLGEGRSEASDAAASAPKPGTPSRVMARKRRYIGVNPKARRIGLCVRPDGQFRQPFLSSLCSPPDARTRRSLAKSRKTDLLENQCRVWSVRRSNVFSAAQISSHWKLYPRERTARIPRERYRLSPPGAGP
jgi:hypothetical protein